jgi:hypothetical protein
VASAQLRTPAARADPPRARTRLDLTALEDRTVPYANVSITTLADASEWGDVGKFRLTRTGDTSGSLTVNVVIDGTAANGTDYATLANTVVFSPGQEYRDVLVTPVDDAIPEPFETARMRITAGSGYTGSGSATVTIADNDAQLTFGLNEYPGAIGYTVPWDAVDPTLASQSIPLTDLQVNLAGQLLPGGGATFTTSPTIQFAHGVFTGVTFALNTSAVAGYHYNSVSMSGMTVSGVTRAGGQNVNATAALAQPGVQLDFSSFTTGTAYRLRVVIQSATQNLESVTITVAAGATTQDVVAAIAAALDGDKVEVLEKSNSRLLIRSKKDPVTAVSFEALNIGNDQINTNITGLYFVTRVGVDTLTHNGDNIQSKPRS